MEKLTNLELVGVVYENDNKKAVLTFLDEDRGHIHEVNFNKQSYENNQFIFFDGIRSETRHHV